MPTYKDYSQELNFAKDLAYKAGAIMREHFSLNVKVDMKKDITPVTAADTEINTLVIKNIKEKYSDHALIAEEENLDISSEYVWICDPLDGTIPYSIGLPISMFSLALYKNKVPILGVLYDPFLDRLYSAIEGHPSQMNDTLIHVSKGGLRPGDTLGMNLWHPKTFNIQNLIEPLLMQQIRFVQIYSIVYLFAYIASGMLKGAVVPPAYIWDRAASKIILTNAGGKLTDENGNDLDIYTNPKIMIASNGVSHDELVKLVKSSLL